MQLDDIDYIEFLLWKAAGKDWGEWRPSYRQELAGGAIATAVEVNHDYDDEGPVHVVIRIDIPENTLPRYFKKSGYYSSYGDGTSWDGGFREVFPVTKTITTFEEKA